MASPVILRTQRTRESLKSTCPIIRQAQPIRTTRGWDDHVSPQKITSAQRSHDLSWSAIAMGSDSWPAKGAKRRVRGRVGAYPAASGPELPQAGFPYSTASTGICGSCSSQVFVQMSWNHFRRRPTETRIIGPHTSLRENTLGTPCTLREHDVVLRIFSTQQLPLRVFSRFVL